MRISRKHTKLLLWGLHGCEALTYERENDLPLHKCVGRTLHEVLYTKGDMPRKHQAYLDSPMNCAALCQVAHMKYQHCSRFRAWFTRKRMAMYGAVALAKYLANAPLKIRKRIPQLLHEKEAQK